MFNLLCIFTSFTSSFQLANIVSLKYFVFNLSQCARARVCACLFVRACAFMCVCACACVSVCGGICLWCDAEWCEYACGVMQNGVNMPVVWCRMVWICLWCDAEWCEYACGVTDNQRLHRLKTLYFRLTIRAETVLEQNRVLGWQEVYNNVN